jgi:hypothetical protein
MFLVSFRGMNGYEAERRVPREDTELRAFAPTPSHDFECGAMAAKTRYDNLVEDGIAGREVDGVIPHVVVVDELEEFVVDGVKRFATVETVLWTYADPDEEPKGSWAEFEPSGMSVAA